MAYDFPAGAPPATTSTNGGVTYVTDGVKWTAQPVTSATLPEAPTDGLVYGRQGSTLSWQPVTNAAYVNAQDAITLASAKAYTDAKTWTYAALPAEVQQMPVVFSYSGKPPASAVINIPIAMGMTVPGGLIPTFIYAGTAPTADTVFTLRKITAGTPTTIGTITIKATPPHAYAGSGASLLPGDVLQLASPAQDATLADCAITVMCMRV